ncbi:DNA-binding transcriptional regulator, HxlR family [Halovenus aranensis]|uniref:DNA-binding transcriptional regulator, HxlR family n=1 Tax=Halovenus aranensis TaxID=890420 RepID=A0A1G8YTL3_9EURY|nr:helix-turn-helix domain-containing protein [Halovenus aranensis]SDK06077.1 DNA-binding transcriptional regulator, HxlR family [Halovenus aranensis]
MSSTVDDTETVESKNEGACSVVRAVERIGSEWRLIVLYDLADGEKRFNELKRSTGASSRTLSRVLDDLGEAELVARRVEDKPIATYYSLTEKGQALCPVFSELESWSEEWLPPGDESA